MLIIGLTGNIASGKSSVAKILRELGADIIDADEIARSVVNKGKPAWKKIVDHFGDSVLDKNGLINRKKLGEIVFNDKKKLNELMDFTHPEILSELNQNIEYLKSRGTKCIVIEATLMDDTGAIKKMIDKMIVVRTSRENQLSRLSKRDNFTFEESMQRISFQLSNEKRISSADYIINNDSDIVNLKKQVTDIWDELFSLYNK